MVHPKRSDRPDPEDAPTHIPASSKRPTSDKKVAQVIAKDTLDSVVAKAKSTRSNATVTKDPIPPSSNTLKAKPAKGVSEHLSAPSKSAETRKIRPRMELSDIKVEAYHSKTGSRNRAPNPPRSSTPPTSPRISPQSSPSQYSQDDDEVDSEGTVSSDEDARSLLAQADSGPARIAPLNIRKKTTTSGA